MYTTGNEDPHPPTREDRIEHEAEQIMRDARKHKRTREEIIEEIQNDPGFWEEVEKAFDVLIDENTINRHGAVVRVMDRLIERAVERMASRNVESDEQFAAEYNAEGTQR